MAFGGSYDFKSDIYMLGLTFFILMSNEMPEKKIQIGPMSIPVKNTNAKLPESYSPDLRNFILKLLGPPDQRPTAKKAYIKAISIFTCKFLKVTSIISFLECLSSIPSLSNYLGSEKMQTYIDSDYKKYFITKIVKVALFYAEPTNFISKLAKEECLKLRILLFLAKESTTRYTEIDVFDFIKELLFNLHFELNKEIKNSQEPGNNNINLENNNEENIDFTNEESVIKFQVKRFLEKYRSKISDQLYYLTKTVYECPECQKNIEYSTTINYGCGLYPYKATIYLNKKDLNILDLFKHYRKKRLFSDENKNCPYCGKNQKDVIITPIIYTSPLNLLLMIHYDEKNENKFKLNIDEIINIQEFVERKDISKVIYR